MASTYYAEFSIAEKVRIDGSEIIGTVTGFQFRYSAGPTYAVDWLHNGTNNSFWLEEYRLAHIDKE
jgi:hypothetical protein